MRGFIDSFNKSRRKITSGVEKTAHESMSDIRFQTTPKCDMLHYSCIFSNPGPLVEELNNSSRSRSGTILYLEIQKGKEAMNTLGFQQQIVGTDSCMKITMNANKGFGQISSNETFFSYIWFSIVKKLEE